MTGETLKYKINEDVLCVLRKDSSSRIIIDYVDIINPFNTIFGKLTELCNKIENNIQQIIAYIEKTNEFEQLTNEYRYCISLSGSYQGFTANNKSYLKEINQIYQSILLDKKNLNTCNLELKVKRLKSEIKERYLLWYKAFAINKTYKLCHEDKSVLTFSHRINGWSNPVYQLTPNFSVEIKTNFGYGRVSYFYTKLK